MASSRDSALGEVERQTHLALWPLILYGLRTSHSSLRLSFPIRTLKGKLQVGGGPQNYEVLV